MNENSGERHSLILQNCRSLSISGVTDADSFDEKKYAYLPSAASFAYTAKTCTSTR